jgi:TonB family protein
MYEHDTNADGKIDNWQYYHELKLRQCHHDDNGDGAVDRIEYFDSKGRWIKEDNLKEQHQQANLPGEDTDIQKPIPEGPAVITGEITKPIPLIKRNRHLRYPENAKEKKVQSKVKVYFEIDKEGNVVPPFSIECLKSTKYDKDFIHSSVETIRDWKFTPAIVDEKPVHVYYYWVFSYEISH